jgi:hypothetical protein
VVPDRGAPIITGMGNGIDYLELRLIGLLKRAFNLVGFKVYGKQGQGLTEKNGGGGVELSDVVLFVCLFSV